MDASGQEQFYFANLINDATPHEIGRINVSTVGAYMIEMAIVCRAPDGRQLTTKKRLSVKGGSNAVIMADDDDGVEVSDLTGAIVFTFGVSGSFITVNAANAIGGNPNTDVQIWYTFNAMS